jgi:hypothetical protein
LAYEKEGQLMDTMKIIKLADQHVRRSTARFDKVTDQQADAIKQIKALEAKIKSIKAEAKRADAGGAEIYRDLDRAKLLGLLTVALLQASGNEVLKIAFAEAIESAGNIAAGVSLAKSDAREHLDVESLNGMFNLDLPIACYRKPETQDMPGAGEPANWLAEDHDSNASQNPEHSDHAAEAAVELEPEQPDETSELAER